MHCDLARGRLSARLDGELPDAEASALHDHLARCPGCRAHEARLDQLHRTVRVRAADAVPDLTAAIVARSAPLLPRPRRVVDPEPVRYALFAVALAQLVLALPLLLLGDGTGATVHVARELGAFDIALAAGLLVAAWEPSRARGLLPVALALAACMGLTAVADIVRGDTPALGEAHHLLDLVGLGLLWALVRRPPLRRPGPGAGVPAPV